jgi:hypothetical protein
VAAIFFALAIAAGSFASAQTDAPVATGSVSIGGLAAHALTLTAGELEQLPHEHVDVTDDDKTKATYDGVELHVLLERAGIELGEALRGARLLDYVVVTAADGYHVVFSLAELDPAFADRKIILADKRNGAALDAKHGPLRIIVPDEMRHARWVREVMSITVSHAPAP